MKKIALIMLLVVAVISCGKEMKYTYICQKTDQAIKIDGKLDEDIWGKARDVGEFRVYDGSRIALYQTQAKILWDEKRLYVAFTCQDPDIWATMRQRDESLYQEEVVELFIDADGDGKTYLEIEVNPLGALFDARFVDIGIADNGRNWNGDIETAVQVNGTVDNRGDKDSSWTVEMAISFASVATAPHIPPKDGDVWRVNLYRIEQGRLLTEYTAWAPVGKLNFHQPAKFGRVVFSERKIN